MTKNTLLNRAKALLAEGQQLPLSLWMDLEAAGVDAAALENSYLAFTTTDKD